MFKRSFFRKPIHTYSHTISQLVDMMNCDWCMKNYVAEDLYENDIKSITIYHLNKSR